MQVACTQCGASVEVAADALLVECPFCSSALVVDGEGVLFREAMRPTVKAEDVPSHLRRFLAGDQTVSGLDREAKLGPPELVFFPFWAFTVGEGDDERTELMPAAPSSLQGLHGLQLPAGETLSAAGQMEGIAPVLEPEVPAATAREWLQQRTGPNPRVRRTVLYHLPLYRVTYSWRGRSYHAGVDAVSGGVFPADFPAKAEAPFVLVAMLAVLVFGAEGIIVSSLLVKTVLYLMSAVPLIGVAWLVSRKV